MIFPSSTHGCLEEDGHAQVFTGDLTSSAAQDPRPCLLEEVMDHYKVTHECLWTDQG